MRKRTIAALALTVLGLLVVSGALPAQTRAWTAGSYDVTAENRLAYLVNAEHKRVCGRSIAVRAPQLTKAARWRSKDMVVRDYFSHAILGGTTRVWNHFGSFGINEWKGAGENIGWNNYPDAMSADTEFQMFMASPGHRALIQACAYNAFGVGAYKGATGKKMYTIVFTVQPVERVIVSRYYVKSTYYSSSRSVFKVYYHARQYVFRHKYNRYGHRWDYGYWPGKGWGWAYDARTR